MKAVLIASIGFAALSILALDTDAQQPRTTVLLAHTLHPVTPSYPGVAADILGIQTGMTVSQAEAIAKQTYHGKPQELKVQDTYTYKEVTVQSHPFVQRVDFANQAANTSDELSLFFSSPVSGNALLMALRTITFDNNANKDSNSASNAPLISTLKASLIKKYGPESYEGSVGTTGGLGIAWAFTKKSWMSCKISTCVGIRPYVTPIDLPQYLVDRFLASPNAQGGLFKGSPNGLRITADIKASGYDRTKAHEMTVSIWDPATIMNDTKETVEQLNAAAIKFHNAPPPTAPKF